MSDDGALQLVRPPHFSERPGKFPWSDVLQYMINPVSSEEFFDRYYEREHLLVQRNNPTLYDPLLSVAKLDAFIGSADLRDGMVDLADQSRQLQREDYVNDDGLIIRRDIVRNFQLGATVIFPQLHHSDPTLASFCQAIENVFSVHTQTNIYLTPPGHQGFPIHYDNHDVFVLHIHGEKNWRLYNTPVDTPYRGEHFERDKVETGEKRADFMLRPGDCLYIPRGMMHDATGNGDEPSLHVTVGLISKTWADLMLEAVSQLMVEDTGFRRSLPVGYARNDFSRDDARKTFRYLTRLIAERAQMDDAMDLLADQFIRSRDQDVSRGILEGARPILETTQFARREFVPWRIAEDEDKVVLISAGGDSVFEEEDRQDLETCMSGRSFTLKDLKGRDPLEMVRRLTAAGAIGTV